MHRQEHDLRVNPVDGLQLPQRLEEAATRHVDVGDDDVGAEAPRGFDELDAVSRVADDIVVPHDQLAERFDDDPMVADEQ